MSLYRVVLPVAAFLAALGGLATPAAAATGADLPGVSVVAPKLAAGPRLEVAGIDDVTADRGNYATVPITVRNDTGATVHHLAVVVVAEQGVEPEAGYANCEYNREDDFTFTAVTCLVDQQLAPGASATVTEATNPMLIRVAREAGGPHTYAVSVTVVGVDDASPVARSGPRLTTHAATTPVTTGSEVATFGVTVGAGPVGAAPGEAGPGEAGPGEAGPGEAGPGEAGPGEAGTGEAGTGEAGPGEAGTGEAGTGEAGTGEAGTGEAGTGDAAAVAAAAEQKRTSSGWLALPAAGTVALLAVRRRRSVRIQAGDRRHRPPPVPGVSAADLDAKYADVIGLDEARSALPR